MSFSSTALRERHRELKALKIFLAYSLFGSCIFHLGLLASNIGKYLLTRVPEADSEAVEITLLDTPIEEFEPKEKIIPKPKPESKPEQKPPIVDTNKVKLNLDSTDRNSQITGGSQGLSQFQTQVNQQEGIPQLPPVSPQHKIEPLSPIPSASPAGVPEESVISKQKPQPEKPEAITKNNIIPPIEPPQPSKPTSESNDDLKRLLAQTRDSQRTQREFSTDNTSPVEPPKPTSESNDDLKRLLAQTRDSQRTQRKFSTDNTPPVEPSKPNQQDSGNLRDTFSGLRENRENTKISSSNTVPFSSDDSNVGKNNNTNPRRRRRIIGGNNTAIAPTNSNFGSNGLGNGTGDSVGDGDGRAACRQCDTNYPAWAKERGIEGKITVAVDTDAQGNVTNVQLLSSSGNSRLDREHLKLARKWKLKPSSNGRQGVRIVTKYELR